MQELKGEGVREMIVNRWAEFKEWLKPSPNDTTLVKSLKMIYKVLAVIGLIVLSPVILVVLAFVFFAAL